MQNLKKKRQNLYSKYSVMISAYAFSLATSEAYLSKDFWCHSSQSIWSGQQNTSEYWLFVKESSCEQRAKTTKAEIENSGLVEKELKSFKCHIYIHTHIYIKFYPTFFQLYNNWPLFLIK